MVLEDMCCPVCTLSLREGMNMEAHLATHSKDKVIEALIKVTANGTIGNTESTQNGIITIVDDTFAPVQSYVKPNPAFVSQTQNYMSPQTQVAAAVTYQPFVTGNGPAIMPQYIQVPTLVAANSSVPNPNQAISYLNNQNAYAHTMYNPIYNPYIPQPYPFVQTMYSHMPCTTELNTQVATEQGSYLEIPSSSTETAIANQALPQVSSIVTSAEATVNFPSKSKPKKFPMKSTSEKKHRIIRQLRSKIKTKTSTVTTVAKSGKVTIKKNKTKSSAKTSLVSKAKSIKAKYVTSLSRVKSPKLVAPSSVAITGPLSPFEAPLPPSLTRAPTFSPIEAADFNMIEIFKTGKTNFENGETKAKQEEEERKWENGVNYKDNFSFERHDAPTSESGIVDPSYTLPAANNILITDPVNCGSGEKQDPEGEEFVKEPYQPIKERDKDSYTGYMPVLDGVHETLECEVEKKLEIDYNLSIRNESQKSEIIKIKDDPTDVLNGEISPMLGGGLLNMEPGKSTENSTPTPIMDTSYCIVKSPIEKVIQTGETRNFVDTNTATYTDLQPASSSKVLQDIGLAASLELNNFMIVDGIKIFFNNSNVQNMPLEPVMKFTSSMRAELKKIHNSVKPENENLDDNGLVKSVIHPGPTKNDISGETLTNSNNDGHLDLRDMSPLTLNIRADESMPARGELSEQESLGAENSSWGLFQSENRGFSPIDFVKSEYGLTDAIPEVSDRTKKMYKCPHCPEMFTCVKDRRLHKNTVHEKSQSPAMRKPKSYVCPHCKEKFTSLLHRKSHVIRNHYFDGKNVQNIKTEGDAEEENDIRSGGEENILSIVPVKLEDETTVKCESPMDVKFTKEMCEVARKCEDCGLVCTNSEHLKEHMKGVNGTSRHKCKMCPETFETEDEYNSHLRFHPVVCGQCGKTFKRKPSLILHLKRHLLVKPYACLQCPKSFITRQKLDEHMNSHSGNKPLKCMSCDRNFGRHSNLIQHRNLHHKLGKKIVKDFVCRCGEVFHSLRKLKWHKEVHDKKPKDCQFCSQKFIHSASVTRHIRRSHMPEYVPSDKKDDNIQCPVCGKVYLRSSLGVHMRVHSGERPFICKICNKGFSTKWNLELHNWTHQSRNMMPFKCDICKSAFFRQVDFIAHSNSHKNYRPYTCNVCGEKFIRKYNCLRHQNEHKKEKKFVCTFNGCNKSFHRSYYLNDHMKVHTGIRPYTCHICGKASSTKSNHNKHVRIHDTRELINTEN